MSDRDLINEIASETVDTDFSGQFAYGVKKEKKDFIRLHRYKVWNAQVGVPLGTPTPGIVMSHTSRERNQDGSYSYKKVNEPVVESVNAVILFTMPQRAVMNRDGQRVCSSDNGSVPSLRIAEPLCRNANAADLAKIFSQWKGYDQAAVDAKIEEVTNESGTLQICGLKTKDGFINICPHARGDRNPKCEESIFVQGYDIDRKREFTMTLRGMSIRRGEFLAPFHEFMKMLRTAGPIDEKTGKPHPLNSFAFRVKLSAISKAAKTGVSFYLLNVSDWKPIGKVENRQEMQEKAVKAKVEYERIAALPPKELVAKPAMPAPRASLPIVNQELPVSFEDDDINF